MRQPSTSTLPIHLASTVRPQPAPRERGAHPARPVASAPSLWVATRASRAPSARRAPQTRRRGPLARRAPPAAQIRALWVVGAQSSVVTFGLVSRRLAYGVAVQGVPWPRTAEQEASRAHARGRPQGRQCSCRAQTAILAAPRLSSCSVPPWILMGHLAGARRLHHLRPWKLLSWRH